MAKRHNDDAGKKEDVTNTRLDNEEPTDADGGSSRRSVLKGAAAAAATLGTVGTLTGGAAAQTTFTPNPDGEVIVEPGEYTFEKPNVGSGDALIGGGNPGDVVLNMESGTMAGSIEGRMENFVVRGENQESKAGLDLEPGSTLDGFVWPDGALQDEDRALFTPEGGDRVTIRNSMWGRMMNNGAYVDKLPVTMENCASVNNNIAGVRIGHDSGTSSGETTEIRNTLVAVTAPPPANERGSRNARGLRIREPGNFLIENCYFVFHDVDGLGDLIELHDGAAGSTVTIRNCAFYNDSSADLVRDKSNGAMDVTIEDCTVQGSGSTTVEPDYSGNGITEGADVSFPTPAGLTGRAAADEVEGFDPSAAPWNGSSGGDQISQEPSYDHTLVMHASADNPDRTTVEVVVDGSVGYGEEAEEDQDQLTENGDGTTTIASSLQPDGLDSFEYAGQVVDYTVPDGYTVDVSVDGTTTTFEDLVGREFAIVAQSNDSLYYRFEVDGAAEMIDLSDQITTGNGDSIDSSSSPTVVTGFTGNTGYGDAYLVHGPVSNFEVTDGDADYELRMDGDTVSASDLPLDDSSGSNDSDGSSGSDDSSGSDGSDDSDGSSGSDDSDDSGNSDGELPHVLLVEGAGQGTQYTFTVSGDVSRNEEQSVVTEDSMPWDEMNDIARDGKVIGVVGNGVDAYNFSGSLTALTVDGDAEIDVTRDA